MAESKNDDPFNIKKRARIEEIKRRLAEIEEYSRNRIAMFDALQELKSLWQRIKNVVKILLL